MAHWKRNLIVVGAAQLLTMIGFSSYLPFVPFYMQELGAEGTGQATLLLAIFNTGGAIAMMLAAPIWGSFSDRYGRKLMLIRATAAGALLAFLMSLARTPETLIVIRIFQGMFCGTLGAAITLVASETPEEHLGLALGLMQTIQFAGQALGPLVGGATADAVSYRSVFPISSAVMAAALCLIVFFVRETYDPAQARAKAKTRVKTKGGWRQVMSGNAGVLLLASASTSFAISILSPVLSLYIKELSPGEGRIATLAGAAMSASAITSSLGALAIGRIGDRVNQKRVLLGAIIGVSLINIPQGLATSTTQILICRALQGFCVGGMMPTSNALLAKNTDPDKRGTVFGLSTAMGSGGRAAGPLLGAGVAGAFGMSAVFFVTASLYAVVAAMVAIFVRATPPRKPVAKEALSSSL